MKAQSSLQIAVEKQAGIEERKRNLLKHLGRSDHAARNKTDLREYQQLGLEAAKLELERLGEPTDPLTLASFENVLAFIKARKDCCDFAQAVALRILYRYPDSKLLPEELRQRMLLSVQNDKYWMDEPGTAGGCYFTENHQILFHSNEYLAGQLLEDAIFPNNGETGLWHKRHAEKMLLRWMDWRITFSFSEWNSSCYYAEDMIALMNLHDYAKDATIQKKASDLITLILFHIQLNSFQNDLGGTQGRVTYPIATNPEMQYVGAVFYVLWGKGEIPQHYHYFQAFLTTTEYQLPAVLQQIGWDQREETENFERHSLNVEEARMYGVDPGHLDDLMFFWGAQMFNHRDVVKASLAYCPEHYFMYSLCKAYDEHYRLYEQAGVSYHPNPDPTACSQVNIYTYKTPEYMLGCAQQYKHGSHAYQQQIWKASLGGKAVVYTTHPGASYTLGRPNYWLGDGTLPKAMAYKNVLVALYHIRPDLAYYPQYPQLYTHAYFPCAQFEQVDQQANWTFGKKGEAYVALCSFQPARWLELTADTRLPEEWFDGCPNPELSGQYDLAARGHNNVWICELGNSEQFGSYEAFVDQITKASFKGNALKMEYHSPTQGVIQFGWNEPFQVNGNLISLGNYPRFENPYCSAKFGETSLNIRHGEESLQIGWQVEAG